MTKHHAFAYLAARLAKAQALNTADLRTARTMEERCFADGQRLLLNEVSGWVIAAFADTPPGPPHGVRER